MLIIHPANIWTATKRINKCVPLHDGHIFKWLCNSSKELGATCITQHQHQHYTFSAPILKRPERSFTNRNLFDHRRPHPGPLHSVQSDRKNLFALNLIHIKLVAETNVSGWSPTSSWPSVNTTIILKTIFQTLQITPMAVQQDSYRWECIAFILWLIGKRSETNFTQKKSFSSNYKNPHSYFLLATTALSLNNQITV